jgi:hypothetical protein
MIRLLCVATDRRAGPVDDEPRGTRRSYRLHSGGVEVVRS